MKLIFTQGPSITTRLVAAALLSIAIMVLDHRYNHLESLRSGLSVLLFPVQYLASLPLLLSESASDAINSRSELEAERDRLHAENLRLRARQQKFEALEAENMRLRGLLDSSFKVGDRVLIAELVAVEQDPFRQQVLINKGKTSGLFVGQPVVDANAVVGQVTHINPFSASVLLITDAAHALPVQVHRNGLRTIALGTGLINRLELPHLPNNADIKVGDLLTTSGMGGSFPPGYPVAEVIDVRREPGQPFASVIAQTTAHLDRIREVLLVWTLDPDIVADSMPMEEDEALPASTAPSGEAGE
ncbi:MAG: rod shape-determining protein MreC [Candidatus Thiodiazotropha sp. (ex Lucina aurantia)]|uniref:rod shape-determining protein MreC n=1 Tax=Candidatus Thiodiazotropha endolucinida TaxID=1655433 RepID=UPI00083F7691|nr:rod shape-determining protein MreC [Candidatus Thiodiazotropha endolucinida]MBT3011604.1 rod shape-determining protein MreC [Candidatus Thiodiazotropha sp. (ex Lucina pensylvanica)]MBT3016363.1 rod shape-determining protein MreC [Candidatus Thiodiazotropha taylori]MBT3039819.1 rod shape-determining protein MreC [Candidatus Thiodiazotropha sp. (ex Codakia orbicularis)]MBV2103978.1 rod shape-determining protein MreC [Candidatus Thiodiazotropha sp. (ex Lucina aurantia)]MBT3023938.1 rod shape-d